MAIVSGEAGQCGVQASGGSRSALAGASAGAGARRLQATFMLASRKNPRPGGRGEMAYAATGSAAGAGVVSAWAAGRASLVTAGIPCSR